MTESPVDEKLALLSLSNEEFADGLARMVKLFTEKKDKAIESPTYPFSSTSSSDNGNYLLLENNMPITGG